MEEIGECGCTAKYAFHSHSVCDCHIFLMADQAHDYRSVTTEAVFITGIRPRLPLSARMKNVLEIPLYYV
jgi:hypothetical protein